MPDYTPPLNKGTLFKNDKKGDSPTAAEYRGVLNVKGEILEISAWVNTAKNGKKYFSLSVREKPAQKPGWTPIEEWSA